MIPATETGVARRKSSPAPAGPKVFTAADSECICKALNAIMKKDTVLTLRIDASAEAAVNGYSHKITTALTGENVFVSPDGSTVVIRAVGMVAVPRNPAELLAWAKTRGSKTQPGCTFIRRR